MTNVRVASEFDGTADDTRVTMKRRTQLAIALEANAGLVGRIEELDSHIRGLNEQHRELLESKQAELDYKLTDLDAKMGDLLEAHKEELRAVQQQLADEQKQHGYCKSSKDTYYKQLQDSSKELESLHEILDTLSNAPSRKFKDDSNYDQTRSLLTRFAIWQAASLANK